jgi:hypothetical protein
LTKDSKHPWPYEETAIIEKKKEPRVCLQKYSILREKDTMTYLRTLHGQLNAKELILTFS